MISVELPDGSARSLEDGATSADLAASIGPGLAKAAVAAKIGDDVVDLTPPSLTVRRLASSQSAMPKPWRSCVTRLRI